MLVFMRVVALSSIIWATALQAAETVTYTYDAQGRLVTAARTGSVNNGVTTTIASDNVDNRTSYMVAGAAGSAGVIVLPLPGFPAIQVGITQ